MASREISGFTTHWRQNEGRGEVSVGYEVNGLETWSVIHVGSASEFSLLVSLVSAQDSTFFDDEENYLRTRSFDVVTAGDSMESLEARGASSSGRTRPSRSATDLTDPRNLQQPLPTRKSGRRGEWMVEEPQRWWKKGR